MESAFRLCQESYPGPVHIGLPSDIADIEIDPTPISKINKEPDHFENNTLKIVSLLENSRHPLMVLGLTAARLDLKNELLEFLDIYRMPVVITPMAKGLIPEDHPSYAGVLFHSLSDYLEDIFEKTDLVIGIGYDPVEFNYESWMPAVPLIHFDITETDMPPEGIIVKIYRPT